METIKGCRTDFKDEKSHRNMFYDDEISVSRSKDKGHEFCTLTFPHSFEEESLVSKLNEEIEKFIKKFKLKEPYHTLVVGLGNDSYTADSVGPKTLKNLHINSHLKSLGLIENKNIVSSIEPGVLGETGIDTKRIVESIVDEIKPDLVILIDSFVTESADNLERMIEITDSGITPGSGLKASNSKIDENSIGVKVLTLGIATALEVKIPFSESKFKIYHLSTNNVDSYVGLMSKIISKSLNRVLHHL